jgi:hypothetical protein
MAIPSIYFSMESKALYVKCQIENDITCLEKEIELEVILEKWQVSRLEELDGASAQQVEEWLKGQ